MFPLAEVCLGLLNFLRINPVSEDSGEVKEKTTAATQEQLPLSLGERLQMFGPGSGRRKDGFDTPNSNQSLVMSHLRRCKRKKAREFLYRQDERETKNLELIQEGFSLLITLFSNLQGNNIDFAGIRLSSIEQVLHLGEKFKVMRANGQNVNSSSFTNDLSNVGQGFMQANIEKTGLLLFRGQSINQSPPNDDITKTKIDLNGNIVQSTGNLDSTKTISVSTANSTIGSSLSSTTVMGSTNTMDCDSNGRMSEQNPTLPSCQRHSYEEAASIASDKLPLSPPNNAPLSILQNPADFPKFEYCFLAQFITVVLKFMISAITYSGADFASLLDLTSSLPRQIYLELPQKVLAEYEMDIFNLRDEYASELCEHIVCLLPKEAMNVISKTLIRVSQNIVVRKKSQRSQMDRVSEEPVDTREGVHTSSGGNNLTVENGISVHVTNSDLGGPQPVLPKNTGMPGSPSRTRRIASRYGTGFLESNDFGSSNFSNNSNSASGNAVHDNFVQHITMSSGMSDAVSGMSAGNMGSARSSNSNFIGNSGMAGNTGMAGNNIPTINGILPPNNNGFHGDNFNNSYSSGDFNDDLNAKRDLAYHGDEDMEDDETSPTSLTSDFESVESDSRQNLLGLGKGMSNLQDLKGTIDNVSAGRGKQFVPSPIDAFSYKLNDISRYKNSAIV